MLNNRQIGGLVLVSGLALWAAAPTNFRTPALNLSAPAQAQGDPIVFYRAPMGEALFARAPKKDSMGMEYLPVTRSQIAPLLAKLPPTAAPATSGADEILFWRDPMGGTEISNAPKKDGMGMDFLPVRSADAGKLLTMLGSDPPSPSGKPAGRSKGRILYYRNPMGLPDTSPGPKRDTMGMDYVPVYEGEDQDSATVTIAPGKIQRTGVRSERVQTQIVAVKVQAPGSIQLDERRITIVATRATAFVEKVSDVTTGDYVKKGEPLLQLYSPDVAAAAAQFAANPGFEGARTRLLNLGVPQTLFAEIERTRKAPLAISWPAPVSGIVLERAVTDGMKAEPGQALFRLANVNTIWALVDVSERDYGRLRFGQSVTVVARALPGRTFAGKVSQIYPQINRETRTARVRIELANPDFALRPDMYVDAEIAVGDGAKVATVPASAVIDSGSRQIVLLDRGEGRFEPRAVRTGQRGEGRVEIREGVGEGDRVVTSANFLIDAESNLKAALKAFASSEAGK